MAVRPPQMIVGVAEPKGFFVLGGGHSVPTAVLVDGGYFLPKYRRLVGSDTPRNVAKAMHRMCLEHLTERRRPSQQSSENESRPRRRSLYRIFFYDCPPLIKKVHHPLTGRLVDLSQSETAKWRLAFHDELKKLRKVALRLGYLNDSNAQWVVHPTKNKQLLRGTIDVSQLDEHDVIYHAKQKGVDMRIGLDIASMTYKKQVDQIILIAGDSDFVPAAKLARREGVDFILDPLWSNIRHDLHEHIDGLRTVLPRKSTGAVCPASPESSPATVPVQSAVESKTSAKRPRNRNLKARAKQMDHDWPANITATYQLQSQRGPVRHANIDAAINEFLGLGWRILKVWVEDKGPESTREELCCLLGWPKGEPADFPESYGPR